MAVESKNFSVGVRIEHPREWVDRTQYGSTHRDLGAADYKLVSHTPYGSVYTFCMCPGGRVIASNSEPDSIVTNGMSRFRRDEKNSNSAVLVEIEKFPTPMDGVRFQQEMERSAYNEKNPYYAPCQNAEDFLSGKISETYVCNPSYFPGVYAADLATFFPKRVTQALRHALPEFDKKMKGFLSKGVLTGVETRSSSPIRILRDENFESNVKGIYPCGEGAGYAGGIMSAAVDGLRCAMALLRRCTEKSEG